MIEESERQAPDVASNRQAEIVRLREALAASEARERTLISALVTAKQTLRAWHNMGIPAALQESQWELYQNSPEMTAINAALPDAPAPETGDGR